MNRTVAIIATTLTAALCGLSGLTIACFGTYMALTPSATDTMSKSNMLILGILVALLGLGIILIPVGVAYISLRLAGPEEKLPLEQNQETIFPPLS